MEKGLNLWDALYSLVFLPPVFLGFRSFPLTHSQWKAISSVLQFISHQLSSSSSSSIHPCLMFIYNESLAKPMRHAGGLQYCPTNHIRPTSKSLWILNPYPHWGSSRFLPAIISGCPIIFEPLTVRTLPKVGSKFMGPPSTIPFPPLICSNKITHRHTRYSSPLITFPNTDL